MFSKYLNRILEKNNVKVRSYAVHPGIVHTEMADPKDNNLIHKLLLMKPEKAATSIIYTCFSPHLERRGGHYISNCMESYCTNFSKDKIKQEELFKKTMQMLNIEKFGNLAIL